MSFSERGSGICRTRPHLVIGHHQIAVVPHQLMFRSKRIVYLRVERKPLLVVVIEALLYVSRGLGIVVVCHVLAPVHTLIARGEEQAKFVFEESVPVCD